MIYCQHDIPLPMSEVDTDIISQMLPRKYRTLTRNNQIHKPCRIQALRNKCLVQRPGHLECVVAGYQSHVVDCAAADNARFGSCEGEGYVALFSSQCCIG